MFRLVLLVGLTAPIGAIAQTAEMPGMDHHAMISHPRDAAAPMDEGQSAFSAIQQVVGLLEADPTTDWSKVDIEALRQHLIDMDNVTLHADVKNEPVAGGVRFVVTGTGPVRDSIRRMVTAHATTMNGIGGWMFAASESDDGADLTVLVPPADEAKLRGLGFIGVMTRGMHHQMHHLMIARGQTP